MCTQFLYPILSKRYGTLTLFRVNTTLLAVTFATSALCSNFASNRPLVWAYLIVNIGVGLITSGISYTCTFQAIRVSTGPENLGTLAPVHVPSSVVPSCLHDDRCCGS